MAGYSRIYCIGGEGGFMGADGINPIHFQILVGDADRQWLEAHYFDKSIKPIGKISTIIPAGPDHPDALIDACLAFIPEYFESCQSLPQVAWTLRDKERIDFHIDGDPPGWTQFREEARRMFKDLIIYEAKLKKLNLRNTINE